MPPAPVPLTVVSCFCHSDQRIRKVMCKHILFVLLTSFQLPVEHRVLERKGHGAHIDDEEQKEMFSHLKVEAD